MVGEAAGLFFESGGARESHVDVTAEKVVSFLYTLSACVTVTRGEGGDVRLWQAKTLYGLSVHCYLSSLSIVPPRESDFVPQVVGQMLHNRLEFLFPWRYPRGRKRTKDNGFLLFSLFSDRLMWPEQRNTMKKFSWAEA